MLKRFLAPLLLGTTLVLSAFTAHASEGYTKLANPGRVDKPGMIEVREFFWYGCSHCYKLEPHLVAWLKTKPANVNFVRTPAALNPQWEANARGYYTAEILGLPETAHAALFQAIHLGRQSLFDQSALAGFYARFGAKAENFNGMYNSFAVSGKVGQSRALAQQYQLEGVPALVVNGKYLLKGEPAVIIAALNKLVAQEGGTAQASKAGASSANAAATKTLKKMAPKAPAH